MEPLRPSTHGRGQHRARQQTVIRELLPRGTSSPFTNTLQTSGLGLQIIHGAVPGITLTFRSKGDDNLSEKVTRYRISERDQGRIISEDFDQVDVEWSIDPRSYPTAGLDRALVVKVYHAIRAVPVETPWTEGQGRILPLIRGTTNVLAGNTSPLWNDDVATGTVPGYGDRWAQGVEHSTPWGRLIGWIEVDGDNALGWAVSIAGMLTGPGDSDPPDFGVSATFKGLYLFEPVLRTFPLGAGSSEIVTFDGRPVANDTGASGATGNKSATHPILVPPGGFKIDVYNTTAGALDFNYCLAVCTGF